MKMHLAIAVAAATVASSTVSAALEGYAIDPASSMLTVTAELGGNAATPQFLGSNMVNLSGGILVDQTATTIQFVGGSLVDVLPQAAPVSPDVGGMPGSAIGDFGLNFTDLFGTIPAAGRDFSFDLTSGVIPIVPVPGPFGGFDSFDASQIDFELLDGSVDYDAGLAFGSADLTGESASNNAVLGDLTDLFGLDFITIPVDATLFFTVLTPNDASVTITGNIVATRIVPEPATASVVLMSGGLLLGRRRR